MIKQLDNDKKRKMRHLPISVPLFMAVCQYIICSARQPATMDVVKFLP